VFIVAASPTDDVPGGGRGGCASRSTIIDDEARPYHVFMMFCGVRCVKVRGQAVISIFF
jgi:hypothetical protein